MKEEKDGSKWLSGKRASAKQKVRECVEKRKE